MAHDGPRSAFELGMERLRQKETEAGIDERLLTDEQKAAIAAARQFYEAKVAEREILHQAALRKAGIPLRESDAWASDLAIARIEPMQHSARRYGR
jgi:hypothetical protein